MQFKMIKVGIREFRKNVAKYLKEAVIVTKRGKHLATVKPAKSYFENKQLENEAKINDK